MTRTIIGDLDEDLEDKSERKKRVKILADEAKLAKIQKQYKFTSEYRDKAFGASQRSVNELEDYFVSTNEGLKKILPREKQNFVIYLRKSTDDDKKQVRSIEDQMAECLAKAEALGLNTDKIPIIIERKSARKSSATAPKSKRRVLFDQMLQDFRTGKYHGLIAWSPDRLSRNMKDGGEIIEMVDEEYIQDLVFCTYEFENSPNGKMMLGILFATSKQYSDKLAVDVKRGIDGNIKDGNYNGTTKKGYVIEDKRFMPDDYNWNLLRRAVDMRLYEDKSNTEIAEFLNKAHLTERKDPDEPPTLVKVTKQMVGNIFEDSFYCGLYKYGDNLTNLIETSTFRPLITADEYIQLNSDVAKNFGRTTTVKTNRNQRLDYGLLHNKVICEYCEVPMQFQHQVLKRGKNKGRWVISFYCRNKACLRHNTEEQKKLGIKLSKSIRAKYILASIEWQLRHLTKQSEEAYRRYIDRLDSQIAADRAVLDNNVSFAKQQIRENEKQYAKYQSFQLDNPKEYEKHHSGKLEHHQELINYHQNELKDNKDRIKELNTSLPSESEFYELTRSKLLDLLNTEDIMVIDAICREFVTNLRAGNDSTSDIKLNPPYNLMTDLDEISTGRG
ncbi:MAG TPA: recombinase family protein [Candidatus Saccharimonadales bacterium]|nr:recombinase family protein [Candidatus Saccharimonadales bacterium]